MELLMDVNWPAVSAGAVLAYLLGWLWYSDKLFGVKWRAGVGVSPDDTSSMIHAMLAQAVGTFLLAWVIGVTETAESLPFAILVGITIAVLIKANGFFCQKTKYAIMVESLYVIMMVVLMIAAHVVL